MGSVMRTTHDGGKPTEARLPPLDPGTPDLVAAGTAAFGAGFRLRSVARTTSTQDLARAAARAGAAGGWCVVADEQTDGRGRQGRTWTAPAGSALLISVVLTPIALVSWVPLAAGVAVAEALDEAAGVRCALKWPNDVLVAGRKLAGIIAEAVPVPTARARPTPNATVVIGIGLNIAVACFPDGVDAVSLHRLTAPAPPPSREALTAALLRALGRWSGPLAHADSEPIARAFSSRAALLGKLVTASVGAERISGRASGLDSDGALLVDTPAGRRRLVAGDVHLVREQGSQTAR